MEPCLFFRRGIPASVPGGSLHITATAGNVRLFGSNGGNVATAVKPEGTKSKTSPELKVGDFPPPLLPGWGWSLGTLPGGGFRAKSNPMPDSSADAIPSNTMI